MSSSSRIFESAVKHVVPHSIVLGAGIVCLVALGGCQGENDSDQTTLAPTSGGSGGSTSPTSGGETNDPSSPEGEDATSGDASSGNETGPDAGETRPDGEETVSDGGNTDEEARDAEGTDESGDAESAIDEKRDARAENMGACCLNGSCSRRTKEACSSENGLFALGASCETLQCPGSIATDTGSNDDPPADTSPTDRTGACCIQGACTKKTRSACQSQNGLFEPGVACNTLQCPGSQQPKDAGLDAGPPAPCCINGRCSLKTESTCQSKGGLSIAGQTCAQIIKCPGADAISKGDIQEDYVDLGTDPKPCCKNGNCTMLTASACLARGGSYRGGAVGSGGGSGSASCTPNPCRRGPPADATVLEPCCMGGKCVSASPSQCRSNGGTVRPNESTCSNVTCTPPKNSVACCVKAAGQNDSVCFNVPKSTCINDKRYQGTPKPNKKCSDNPC